MMLFENWVVTDQTAETFLRDHNGFNFIIDRLFQETAKKQEDFDDSDDDFDRKSEDSLEGVSSDESSQKSKGNEVDKSTIDLSKTKLART